MKLHIRDMVSKDREALYEMMQKTGVFTMQALSLAMELIDHFLFDNEQQEYQVVIGEGDNQEVIAFACFGPTAGTEGTCKLHLLVVSPAWQHRGIGQELLAYTEKRIHDQGGRMIVIEISSQDEYAIFVRFFSNQGYKSVGRIKSYYRSGEDILFLVKYL